MECLPRPEHHRTLMWATEFKCSTQTQPSCLHIRVQDPEPLVSKLIKAVFRCVWTSAGIQRFKTRPVDVVSFREFSLYLKGSVLNFSRFVHSSVSIRTLKTRKDNDDQYNTVTCVFLKSLHCILLDWLGQPNDYSLHIGLYLGMQQPVLFLVRSEARARAQGCKLSAGGVC